MMEASEPSRSRSKRALVEHVEFGDVRHEDDEDWTKRKYRSSKTRRLGEFDESEELEIVKRSTLDKNDALHHKERIKPESIHSTELEKMPEEESSYSEIKENKEKGCGDLLQERNLQRQRWEEIGAGSKSVENSYKEKYDSRNVIAFDNSDDSPSRDKEVDIRYESDRGKSKNFDFSTDKAARSDIQDEDINKHLHVSLDDRYESVRGDKPRYMRERSSGSGGHAESYSQKHYSRPYGDKGEKHRQDRDFTGVGHDEGEGRDGSLQFNDEGHAQLKDKNIKEVVHHKSPERSGRNSGEYDLHDRGAPESDIEKGMDSRVKERDKEIFREDRSSKGKESSWDEKHRDWEGTKDYWRRNQSRQDAKDGEKEMDPSREWDSQRHEHDRMEREKLHRRPSYRKDNRSRSDGVRSEHTDSIEIMPTKNLDFGREDSVAIFPGRGSDTTSLQDFSHGDAFQEMFQDDDNSGRNSYDSQVEKGRNISEASPLAGSGQSTGRGIQPPFGSKQGLGSLNRTPQLGSKGGRPARTARGGRMTGRDAQRIGMPLPILGPPFGPLSLPPGSMQPIGTNMPTPGPPIPPSVFLPPFAGPLLWAARGMDMNMLPLQTNLPPIPPHGHALPQFPTNVSNPGMFFDQLGAGRGIPSNVLDPGLSSGGSTGRGVSHDKTLTGWGPRTTASSGKTQSRGEQNDYSQNFVDTGMRPQNFIRELEISSVVEDYPKLRELIQRKDEIVAKSSSPPMYYKCDLKDHMLSPEFFGTKFDVVLVDPPWEEYAHRAPGGDHIDCWTFEEIQNLKIEAIADTPSFIFLWVGDGMGLEQGRQCLRKWGFRRCEDICWVKTNKKNATSGLRHDSNTLFQHSKEHCLMGIKGTVRRSTDGHIIHANIDTDIIIAEEPPDGSTKKPEDMYRIIEHFALGRRRLELFGEDHNIRPGWLTVGKGLSSSNFNAEAYVRSFADRDGKVWQGGGGRNPPPEAPHLVLTTPEIESLRPRSPPPKNQQLQQQPLPNLPGSNPSNKRSSASSPQNPAGSFGHQDALGSEFATPGPWWE